MDVGSNDGAFEAGGVAKVLDSFTIRTRIVLGAATDYANWICRLLTVSVNGRTARHC